MTKSAFITIVGRPNVGKSTLLNAIIGQKVAIVSRKPQTTRNRITGILTRDETQIVFMDTPGMHMPKTRLGEHMVRSVKDAMSGVDAVLLVVEPITEIHNTEVNIINSCKANGTPVILVINKSDTINGEEIGKLIEMYTHENDFAAVVPISAIKNEGVEHVVSEVLKFSAESVWYFEGEDYTDQPERVIAAELVREKALKLLDKEVPHGIAVEVMSFKEDERKALISISVTIFCEKDSHKGIIIGKGGAMLKRISTYAREDMEEIFGCKVFLECWVKVKENWRDSDFMLSNFGYDK